jgi:Arc/MetJ-type ribon-helix-helix transcriptional regulator
MSDGTLSGDRSSDGRRVTVRLPGALCEDLDTLVEEGHFFNTSEVVRTALRRIVTASDVQAQSLDVHLVHRVADEPDAMFDFTTHEVADALDLTPQQLVQSIQAHHELADPLVAIEQRSNGTNRGARWRATPRLSVGGAASDQTTEEANE